jgi:hypothetical protein
MAVNVVNGPVIAAGESLSSVLDLSSAPNAVTKIIFPDAWSQDPRLMLHSISFQWSPDGIAFYDLYNITGDELLVKVVTGGMAILPRDIWVSGFMKFRSGPSRHAVPQAETRTFKCILE